MNGSHGSDSEIKSPPARELSFSLLPGAQFSPQERLEMLDLCSRAFRTNYARIYAAFSDPVHVLARLDGKLVSHALWVTRWIQCGGGPLLRAAYVEAVATHPDYREKGFASQVMGVLRASILDYELGALSPLTLGLYERLGWERWRGPVSIRSGAEEISTPYEIMILRLPRTPALDLDGSLSAEWRPGELW